jgi:hypothetical protein
VCLLAPTAVGLKSTFHDGRPLYEQKRLEETLILTGDSHRCQCDRACATVPIPATSVGSPPEVFHSCGKKCGKATVFAAMGATDAEITPLPARRKRKTARFY